MNPPLPIVPGAGVRVPIGTVLADLAYLVRRDRT